MTVILIMMGMGFVVALMSTWLGIGGGLIIVPFLPMLVPISPLEALATSLATLFLVALANVFGFKRQGVLRWPEASLLGLSAAATSFFTAQWVTGVSALTLKIIFGVILIFLTIIQYQAGRNARTAKHNRGRGAWVGVGLLCGVVSASTGLGAGLVAMPLLDRLRLLPTAEMVPAVNMMILINTLFGLMGIALSRPEFSAWRIGPIHIDFALWIFAGSQCVAPLSIRYQSRFPVGLRRGILFTIMIAVSVKTWVEVARLEGWI